jgi:hypothetical protein
LHWLFAFFSVAQCTDASRHDIDEAIRAQSLYVARAVLTSTTRDTSRKTKSLIPTFPCSPSNELLVRRTLQTWSEGWLRCGASTRTSKSLRTGCAACARQRRSASRIEEQLEWVGEEDREFDALRQARKRFLEAERERHSGGHCGF